LFRFAVILMLFLPLPAMASELMFSDFVGTWTGHSSSETAEGRNYAFELVIDAEGGDSDSSGYMMPTTYPDTQEVRYDSATNRLIFKYLKFFYSGSISRFYQSYLFEVAAFTGDYLDLHYNPHDLDPAAPHVQRLELYAEGYSPPVPRQLFLAGGRQTQAQAGHPVLTGPEPVEKTGAGTVVFDSANSYTGPTTISGGTLEVAHAEAVPATAITVTAGGTLSAFPGTLIKAPSVTLAGGGLGADAVAGSSTWEPVGSR
jgi:autotransporter-associated beta strand protein